MGRTVRERPVIETVMRSSEYVECNSRSLTDLQYEKALCDAIELSRGVETFFTYFCELER